MKRMKTTPLTPAEARILAQCSLHYHFRQQQPPEPGSLDQRVRRVIQQLHAAGGPSRVSLRACLRQVADLDEIAPQMVEHYYHRLRRSWLQVIAANEELSLDISIAGYPVHLHATIDRLDKSNGGLVAVLIRTEEGPPPLTLETDPAIAIYHALVAANYPHRRPVRIREVWLQVDESVEVELTESLYRAHLSRLRQPIQALARSEVMATPGLHCDSCPFKYGGCPVYSHEAPPTDLESPPSDGKITPRTWIFKI